MRTTLRAGVAVVVCALALFVRDVSASTITLDFEELAAADALIHPVGTTYTADGFTLSTLSPPPAGCCDPTANLNTIGILSTSFAGSTSLAIGTALYGVTLSRDDGGAFDLLSIDLAEVPSFDGATGAPIDLGSFELLFVGTKRDGSSVQSTATIDPFPTVTTFRLPQFTDLTSVQWFQGPGGDAGPTHQFDNIRLRPVPEPSTISLLAVGLFTFRRTSRRWRS